MAVAAVFMVRQRDLKRLLAYSSVEHMGILVLGIGIGGLAVFGTFLHVINNGLTKAALFLCAGNIQSAYGSKLTERYPRRHAPLAAHRCAFPGLFPGHHRLAAFRAFCERIHHRAARPSRAATFLAGILFLVLLGAVFIGMGSIVLAVVQGNPPEKTTSSRLPLCPATEEIVHPSSFILHPFRDSFGTTAPICVAVAIVLLLGICIPSSLWSLLHEAAAFLEVKR